MIEEFVEIHLKREELARKQELLRQAKNLAQAKVNLDRQEKYKEKARFDGMVRELLDQLRQAAYPKLEISGDQRKWSLGRWNKQLDDGSLQWMSVIDIYLNYDIDNRALNFNCCRYQKMVPANLSRQGLVEAIKKLFPVPKS